MDFEIEIPTSEQEYERIIQFINNREFYKKFGYGISLPENFIELYNSEEIISEENYEKYYQEFLKDYNKEKYQEFYKLLQENIKIIRGDIKDRFLDLNKKWGFKIFNKYKIRLTIYGVGGSYNWSDGFVIVNVKNKNKETLKKDLKTIVHELIHIGIEENIVNQFELSHPEKERVVDLILKKHFPEYFYREQDRGDKRITEKDIDMENLPEAIKKYKEREYKK